MVVMWNVTSVPSVTPFAVANALLVLSSGSVERRVARRQRWLATVTTTATATTSRTRCWRCCATSRPTCPRLHLLLLQISSSLHSVPVLLLVLQHDVLVPCQQVPLVLALALALVLVLVLALALALVLVLVLVLAVARPLMPQHKHPAPATRRRQQRRRARPRKSS